jgi:integrase
LRLRKKGTGKRGNNEGTVFKRSDGRWCAVAHSGWENGKRRRKYVYGKTRAKVAEALNKVLQEKAQGLPIAFERQTVAVFLRRWLEDSVKPSVRPLTYQQYHQHVRLFLVPILGTLGLAKLRPQHVQAFLNEKLKGGLSPRTVQLSLVILRHALDQAVSWGLVARNVAKLVDSPKVKRPETQYLTPEQARQFLDSARGKRLEALYSVALARSAFDKARPWACDGRT